MYSQSNEITYRTRDKRSSRAELALPEPSFYFLSLMDRAGSYGLSDGVSITSGSVYMLVA